MKPLSEARVTSYMSRITRLISSAAGRSQRGGPCIREGEEPEVRPVETERRGGETLREPKKLGS